MIKVKTKPKVDQQLIHKAKELRAKGRTQEEIAVELGVSQGTISVILRSLGLGGQLVRKRSMWSQVWRQYEASKK